MRGRVRIWTLALVWGTATVAIALIAAGRRFPPAVGTCVYLGMGWGVVICYAHVARIVTHRAMLLVLAGGLFYSVAQSSHPGWPPLWPGVFGVHDLFHLFVIAGSLGQLLGFS